jgi:hypothetical protein
MVKKHTVTSNSVPQIAQFVFAIPRSPYKANRTSLHFFVPIIIYVAEYLFDMKNFVAVVKRKTVAKTEPLFALCYA